MGDPIVKNIHGLLLVGCSALALAGCGPNELASPGTGGNVIINPGTPGPSPSPSPTPTPGGGVTPAADCPNSVEGLSNEGTIEGPTGEYRVCSMPQRFNVSSTLPYVEGVLYRMNGRVDVGTDGGPVATAQDSNVTLTIEPGVVIYSSGEAFLNVNRGNKINAVGTAARPIVFTSRENVLGQNGDLDSGQWGGLIISGRAPVTDCEEGNATPGSVDCERQVEGTSTPALYGGATPNDNSGRVSYVQLRYSGFTLSGGSELQSLTTGGVGSQTQFDHIQSFNSSDDGMELFGGVVNMKHLVFVGAEDDTIDTDTGVKANLQYVIAVQNSNPHDTIMETDSNGNRDQTPRQDLKIANFTFIHPGTASDGGDAAIYIRGGADVTLINGIVVSPGDACLRLRHEETVQPSGNDENGPPMFRSVVMQCASNAFVTTDITSTTTQAVFNAGTNVRSDFTPTLTSLFINGSNESGVTASDPSQVSSFFDATNYIGAVRNSSDTWYEGWTCNSSTANFGNSNTGACTSLPVY